MVDIPSHHIIYGTLHDYLTDQEIIDTDDERYRQKIARFLVTEKGYNKQEIIPRLKIETLFNKNFVTSTIDMVITLTARRFIVIRYGPGSLVTRERPAIAAAKVLVPKYQIPYAVVTNGENAEFLETRTGKILAQGMQGIPSRLEALELLKNHHFEPPPTDKRKEQGLRILNAFDQEICCASGPCVIPTAPEG